MSALLRNLVHPCFDIDTLNVLSAEGIETVADILITPNRSRISELVGIQKTIEIFRILESSFCPPIKTGLQVLREHLQQSHRIISTGCDSLDNLLGGGVKCGEWTDFAGQMATGKTQLCFALSLHCASALDPTVNDELLSGSAHRRLGATHRVLFLDCSGSFSHARLLSIASASPSLASVNAIESILSEILVVKVLSPQALLSHLTELHDCVSVSSRFDTSPWKQIKLIVIDGLAPMLTPSLSAAKQTTGHGWLAEISRMLKIIMIRLRCAVVTTNWMSSTMVTPQHAEHGPKTASLRPGLGEGWASMMNNIVLLTRVTGMEEAAAHLVAVEVAKSSGSATNHVIRLQLSQKGFDDA